MSKNTDSITRRSLADRASLPDWSHVDGLKDADIAKAVAEDDDAAPLLDDAWLADASKVEPLGKVLLSIRVDRDVLAHFKATGPGYQTRMNQVLRAFVDHDRKRG